MTDVAVTYNGDVIATLDESGTIPIPSKGTWLVDDISIEYTKSSGGSLPELENLITNGDFSKEGATTSGWSAISPSHSSLSVSDGALVLTHTVTSNRQYGMSYNCSIQAGHTYFAKFKFKKSADDSDADSRQVRIYLYGSSNTFWDYIAWVGCAQNDVIESYGAVTARNNSSAIRITFTGSVATAASNNSMIELYYIELYDITDLI